MISKLINKIKEKKAAVCIGLDPTLALIPEHIKKEAFALKGESLEGAAQAIFNFNKAIVDECFDLIPAVKPQIAMYEQYGIPGLMAYEKTIAYCKEKDLLVIGDVKRGDIGSTSAAYASAHLGEVKVGEKSFRPFASDFLTVNPYMGSDCVNPFTDECIKHDKGLFILVKTSNPSSGEFQDRLIEGRALYEHVAEKVAAWGEQSMDGEYSNIGAVVGATYPKMSEVLRKLMPKSYFLVPGYGAQGASAKDLRPCFNDDGLGAIVNSSRGIIAAYKLDKYKDLGEKDFAKAARQATKDMIEDINSVL